MNQSLDDQAARLAVALSLVSARWASRSVKQLGLSSRVAGLLAHAGAKTVGDLAKIGHRLLTLRNFGCGAYEEVIAKIRGGVERRQLSFDDLRDANVERQRGSFPACQYWSATDWATALAGEVGEACNRIKKLRRSCLDKRPAPLPENTTAILLREQQVEEIGKELADVITYVDLVAWHFGLDLGEQVRSKFNEVSDRVESEVRL